MAGVEVKISATPREYALIMGCVEMAGDLLSATPEKRAGIAKDYLRQMGIGLGEVQQLFELLSTGKRKRR